MDAIVHFLRCLTRLMREQCGPAATVLWYDSVTADTGELQWQNGTRLRLNALLLLLHMGCCLSAFSSPCPAALPCPADALYQSPEPA